MRTALVFLALAPLWAQTTAGPVTPIVSGGTVKVTGGTSVVSQGTSIVSGGTTVIGGGGGVGPSTYTFVTYTYAPEAPASSMNITSPALTLSTGDFVMWFCRLSTGGANTVSVSSTPANTVGSLTQVTWNSATAQVIAGYILSAVAGSTTFTCSFTSAATYRSMVVLQYHHSGAAAAFDTQDGNNFIAATVTSRAFNTTGSPGLVIMCATWAGSPTITAGMIGGTTATMRGVTGASITATADAGCEDASLMTPQTGITATIIGSGSLNGAYSVGVFK